MQYFVYILRCNDNSYYTGSHRGDDVANRVAAHNMRLYKSAYTSSRLPVTCVWSSAFERADEAVAMERQIKGWSRVKKEALIEGRFEDLPKLSKRGKRE